MSEDYDPARDAALSYDAAIKAKHDRGDRHDWQATPVKFLDGKVELRPGDCREVIRAIPNNSIDSVVTDPPYALVSIVKRFGGKDAKPANGDVYARSSAGFMGKQWDTGETAFAAEFWAEVFRVLKPGGHVVAFSGTRTYHRMTCAIEDAGFEIRDQLAWVYGSGFPKSHDVSRAIDKAAGAEREVIGVAGRSGSTRSCMAGDFIGGEYYETVPATDAARQWQGWGTALKPAWEPICLARKPLIGNVAETVLAHGTGALNIDGCRVEAEKETGWGGKAAGGNTWNVTNSGLAKDGDARPVQGRWPANIVHDGSDEVLAGFPETASGKMMPTHTNAVRSVYGQNAAGGYLTSETFGDSGSAARFFYAAKADQRTRLGARHPTVKPLDLMQWLVRLVTPKGGLVLDPFAGTGTTGEAAWREGMRAMLIEREADSCADIKIRMNLAREYARREAIAKTKRKLKGAEGTPLFPWMKEGHLL